MPSSLPNSYTTNLENIDSIADRFSTEIASAKESNYSSIKYIQTHLPSGPMIINPTKACIVIVGGSHLRITEIEIDKERYKEIGSSRSDLPLLESGAELLELIAERIPSSTELILLNLAFPVSPIMEDGMLDAVLLEESKGHSLKDLLGKRAGKELKNYLKRNMNRDVRVSCVNDNICTTLSVPTYPTIGFIAGTGINVGFRKEADKIVNLEAGYFDGFRSNSDLVSIEKKDKKFETEIAGAYLPFHYNHLKKNDCLEISKAKHLSRLAKEGDKLAIDLLSYSATLTASVLAGTIRYLSTEEVNIVVEGSLVIKGYEYLSTMKYALHKLTPNTKITWESDSDSALLGGINLLQGNY